jgi:hypothetical protein
MNVARWRAPAGHTCARAKYGLPTRGHDTRATTCRGTVGPELTIASNPLPEHHPTHHGPRPTQARCTDVYNRLGRGLDPEEPIVQRVGQSSSTLQPRRTVRGTPTR